MNVLILWIMWCEVFIRLLLAHVVGDFVCQTDGFCRNKLADGMRGPRVYLHSLVIFVLSWIALWSFSHWWLALVIGVVHFLIDAIKRKDNLGTFLIDQIAHVVCIAIVAYVAVHEINCAIGLDSSAINTVCLYALVFLLNGKPANLLIKYLLKAYSVKSPKESMVLMKVFVQAN